MKSLKQIREASGGKEAYQKFFNSLLKKFGVDSPSELDGKKKKDFFDAIDKGWDGDDEPKEKGEATIHISNKINERLKPGKGSLKGKDAIGTDVDWDNVGDEKKWIKQAKSKYKVTIKKDVGKYHSGASISGKKADIIKFLQGPMYGGLDDADIEDMWPDLVEKFEDPDNLDPDTTANIDEKAPPGMEDTVKKLKVDHSDEEAFAIAWSIYNDKKKNEAVNEECEVCGQDPCICDDNLNPDDQVDEVRKGKTIRGAKLGKSYPVMNASQKKKIEAIAKKHSGDMQRAIKDIEKLKKGMSDNPDVMEILRLANEAVDCDARLLGFKAATKRKEGMKQKGKVLVDRRTKGYRAAEERRRIAREKREAKKEANRPTIDPMYGADADPKLKETIKRAQRMMEDPAANSNAGAGVDMAPNARNKKKGKYKVVKRPNY